jgi:hypothetical protein
LKVSATDQRREKVAACTMEAKSPELRLLEKTQALIALEKELTGTLEKVEPWLRTADHAHRNLNKPRVRPIPSTMEEAELVLQVARNLASRTSAPAGWNPQAPVVGFTTPNPMPHQLRGGALATLQLERAKQADAERKKALARRKEAERAKQRQQVGQSPRTQEHQKQHEPRPQTTRRLAPQAAAQQQPLARPKQEMSMNLSDSSSEEEEDDDNMEED